MRKTENSRISSILKPLRQIFCKHHYFLATFSLVNGDKTSDERLATFECTFCGATKRIIRNIREI